MRIMMILFVAVFSFPAEACDIGSLNLPGGAIVRVSLTPSACRNEEILGVRAEVDAPLSFDITISRSPSSPPTWDLESVDLQLGSVQRPARIRRLEEGTFFVDNITLPSPGTWQIKFNLKTDKESLSETLPLVAYELHPAVTMAAKKGRSVLPFSFTKPSGAELSLSMLKGKVWVVNFFFASCPMVCPLMTKKMQALQRHFKDNLDFHLVSITTDPKNDSAEVLNTYAMRYGANQDRWHFLRGDPEEVARLSREGFHLGGDAKSPSHTKILVLVDKDGAIVGNFNTDKSGEMKELRKMAASLLR